MKSIKVGILTLSDKGSIGQREDTSSVGLREILQEAKIYEVVNYKIIPDDFDQIVDTLNKWSEEVELILTTGGTGFSKRDITPEATKVVLEREVPGISEVMRSMSLEKTKKAMLSRGVSGIKGNCLIVNLPGSKKGSTECLSFIIDVLEHGLDVLNGRDSNCAVEPK